MEVAHTIRRATMEEFIKSLDTPPCACGNDLGLPGGAEPVYDEDTAGILQASEFVYIAVRAPATRVVRTVRSTGRPVSRVTIQKGDFHVMANANGGGGQFNLAAHLLDPADTTQHGTFVTTDDHAGIYKDPRAILLRRFWRRSLRRVEPIALVRTGDVPVLGRIAKVRLGTRWFDGPNVGCANVHGDLGRCTVVQEGDQEREEKWLRFLKPGDLFIEFTTFFKPDGSRITL